MNDSKNCENGGNIHTDSYNYEESAIQGILDGVNDDPYTKVQETEPVIAMTRTKPMIVHQEHAPEWLVDNKYILHGYRVDFNRKRDLVWSLFMKHNELLNIWTHLIGGLIFVGLVFYIIFYFDVFNILYNKISSLFSSDNIDAIKKSVPAITNSIK
jgi:Haemolysin-III related